MKNTEFDPIDLHAESSLPEAAKKPSGKQPESSSASEETEKVRVKILAGSSVGKLYRLFREDGMSKHESLYNALYLACHNRYENAPSVMRGEFKSIQSIPRGWSGDKRKLHKNNVWSMALTALGGLAHLTQGVKKAAGAVGRAFARSAIYRTAWIIRRVPCALSAEFC